MAINVNIGEAKTNLSRLIAAVEAGEKVVISRAGEEVAELVLSKTAKQREIEQRRAALEAWIGSGEGTMSEEALDLAAAPLFTDEELDAFDEHDRKAFGF
ncbi:MAG: type II toxin-antitoxin system prevent-host-death family antitoxin [Pseudomonadota bacterium]